MKSKIDVNQQQESNKPVYWEKSLPIQFIDSIDKKKHIVLFYEDHEYAKIIQFHFIKKGLEIGEEGIFVTPENIELVKQQMGDFGIDIQKHHSQIHIFQNLEVEQYGDAQEYLNEDITRYAETLKKPSRLTGNWISFQSSDNRVRLDYGMDELFHKNFDAYDCSVLCCYYLKGFESTDWIKKFLQIHHSVIFAPSIDDGIAFDTK